MHCILCYYNNVSCILELHVWLSLVSAVVWIGFLLMMQFLFARNMFMHSALHIFFFLLSLTLSSTLFFFPYLWHPKRLFHPRTQSHVMVPFLLLLLPLFQIPLGSVMRSPKKISMRTSLTGQFIRNAKSFCLIFQTLLFLLRLALKVGLLYVRYLRGVPVCSYRSSTPVCTPLIPLCLSLQQYFEAHVL